MDTNKKAHVSVVILTLNEEANLPYALQSVKGWSDDIHVVDCGSTDRTIKIAKIFGAQVHYNPWTNWAVQRNWTQDNVPLRYEWILYLDADEQLTPESRQEILERTRDAPENCHGFYIQFDFFFIGRRVRNGMQPHLRLIRRPQVRWRAEGAREYCSASANSPVISARLIHKENRGLSYWSHNYIDKAKMEANYQLHKKRSNKNSATNNTETKQLFRHKAREFLFAFCPPFLRVIPFFLYRLLVKTDIRDGWAGFAHTFFFGLWYPMLVDAMYIELCMSGQEQSSKDVVP